ncbi:hypothetical protein [Reichenbachiella versicolor]|uniref:hypothetical protein n=1 Tax=Reichenbachiella versicolor TaxID=1821036 RepID=UPI001C87D20F|nr:hypothetical protein [Reichenbachiella versicolor]
MWRNFTHITLKVLVVLSAVLYSCNHKEKTHIVYPSLSMSEEQLLGDIPHYSEVILELAEKPNESIVFTKNSFSNGNEFEVSCFNNQGTENWVFKLTNADSLIDSLNVNSLVEGIKIEPDGMLSFYFDPALSSFLIYLDAQYYISVFPDSITISEIEDIP